MWILFALTCWYRSSLLNTANCIFQSKSAVTYKELPDKWVRDTDCSVLSYSRAPKTIRNRSFFYEKWLLSTLRFGRCRADIRRMSCTSCFCGSSRHAFSYKYETRDYLTLVSSKKAVKMRMIFSVLSQPFFMRTPPRALDLPGPPWDQALFLAPALAATP